MRGGNVVSNDSSPLQSVGQWGLYWSSRAGSNTYDAYYLRFYTSVDPSYSNSRYIGYPLRCLIPTT